MGRSEHVNSEAVGSAKFHLIATLLMLLAFGLRLHHIGLQSLWLNELDSWWISRTTDLSAIINREVMVDPHPPGYNLFLHYVIKWFGATETVLRIPSSIAGSLSVYFIALLGRRLFDPATGLTAAALFCVLWAPVYYAQEARAYSLLMTMTILSTHLVLVAAENINRPWRSAWPAFVGYTLCAATVAYLHYFGLLIVGVQALILLIRVGATRRAAFLMLAVGACYAPWLPFMMEDLGLKHWIKEPGTERIATLILFAFNKSVLLYVLLFLPLHLWAIGLCGYHLLNKTSDWRRDPTVLVLLWICVPVAVAFLKSLISQPVWNERNLLICVPALHLLAARGLTALPLRRGAMIALSAAVPAAAFMHLVFAMEYYQRPTKDSFRDVVNYVIENDGDAAVPIVGTRHAYYYDYYFRKFGSDRRTELTIHFAEDSEKLRDFVEALPEPVFWLLQAGVVAIPRRGMPEILASDFEVLEQFDAPVGRATLYRLKKTPGAQ